MCNNGCILPEPGFLERDCAEACTRATRWFSSLMRLLRDFESPQVVLRLVSKITDLAILGKAMGSGFPIECDCGFSGNYESDHGRKRNSGQNT